MQIEDILELLPHHDEVAFKSGLIQNLSLLFPDNEKYKNCEIALLMSLSSGDYPEFLELLLQMMLKEFRSRLLHLGLDAFNSENGVGHNLRSEQDLENFDDDLELILTAVNMGGITPTQERCLFFTIEEVSRLDKKINVQPTQKQRKRIKGVILGVHIFFKTPKLEKWEVTERYLFMVKNSEPDDLVPFLKPFIKKFTKEEKERTAQKLFLEFMEEITPTLILDSIEYGFRSLWFESSEKSRENLIYFFNQTLHDVSDEDLGMAKILLGNSDVFRLLDEGIKRQYINSRFVAKDESITIPIMINSLMIELHDYGIGLLEEESYESAAEVFLNFYYEYGDESTYELHNYELSASMFIPCFLGECSLGFVNCFVKVLDEFVSSKIKHPTERKGLVVLNDLINAIIDREDYKEEKKLRLIELKHLPSS